MSKTVTITLANGDTATIVGTSASTGVAASISFQLFNAAGAALGPSQVLAEPPSGDFFFHAAVDATNFAVVPLTTGGFQLVTNEGLGDSSGFPHVELLGVGVDATGAIVSHGGSDGQIAGNFSVFLFGNDGGRVLVATPLAPQMSELNGGRFAVVYDTADLSGALTTHLGFGTLGGLQTDAVVVSPPDAITHNNGDITLTWNDASGPIREVFGEDGSVLMARGASHVFTVGVADGAVFSGFDPAHDQLSVLNPDGSVAGGTHSTLTFNTADHTLTWDPDSEGPLAATTVAVLPNAGTLGVANLADAFRPEVLKVIAADGSSTIQWFDSDNSQTWDNLIATETPAGAVVTYTTIFDDGTKTVFNFDADNSQPYTRYVDQDDAAGHVLVRTVLLDDGESWLAKFQYAAGQIVSYEVDSFDAAGHQVGQGFFNADGSILTH